MLLPRPRQASYGSDEIEAVDPAQIEVVITSALPSEGYRLTIGSGGVTVEAADPAGAAHARRTLAQLVTAEGRWPHAQITDHPDLAVRGAMLDMSRDKVPTMPTLLGLIDQLAAWKVNHLQLYIEHTFAQVGHEEVWRYASPFTPDEIRDLWHYCAARHIELVPNQNLLGHMERFLVHPSYRQLALQPEGFLWLGFVPRTPSTLDPRLDDAFELAAGLVDGWIDAMPEARRFNVGLDEPWELGDDMIPDYLSWLDRLRALPALEGREMLMWDDIVMDHPELADSLPAGVTLCEWGYEADHRWRWRLSQLEGRDPAPWICPGTSAWLSLFGRTANMKTNISQAVDAGIDHGVEAMLVTDWGDWGHHQYLPVSLPGLAWAAAQGWARDANRDLDLAAALDRHAVEATGPGWGAALMELGDAYLRWGPQVPNVAAPFLHLWMTQLPITGVRHSGVDAVRGAIADAPRRGDVGDEIRTTIDLANVLLDDADGRIAGDGTLPSIPAAKRSELAERMDAVMTAHEGHWLLRNRPGGLSDSLSWLARVRDSYRSGEVDGSWFGPLRFPEGDTQPE